MPSLSRSCCTSLVTISSFSTSVCSIVFHLHVLAAREDFMTSVLLVPLGERGRHVHLLDDVAPAHAGVVGAEGNFAFLRGVRNDALLGAAEVVVEQILEPHSRDEQEVPAILAALHDVVNRAVRTNLAVVLARSTLKFLSNFFSRSINLKCVGDWNGS